MTDTRQVQTVSVPACADGRVVADLAVGMSSKCTAKQLQPAELECEGAGVVEFSGERGGPRTVFGISTLVLSPCVVQQAKEEHDLDVDGLISGSQVEPGRRHRVPMALTVQPRFASPRGGQDAIYRCLSEFRGAGVPRRWDPRIAGVGGHLVRLCRTGSASTQCSTEVEWMLR